MTIDSQSFPAKTFIEPEPGGLLYLNNRPYRGKLLLASDGGTLHAVNYINLRHYLYSVVASEVSPSWSPEAIKAQAVAARSYALTYYFKPANSLYHIGSDEYFQVYSGTQREDDRSNQAVDMTSGEYVSYKGGVVESLYAASDDIVAEAFAGKGMSQLGAKSLAEKGYKYDQILANYYPSTKVGKIAKDE
jgi:stage II sporulation protein D